MFLQEKSNNSLDFRRKDLKACPDRSKIVHEESFTQRAVYKTDLDVASLGLVMWMPRWMTVE